MTKASQTLPSLCTVSWCTTDHQDRGGLFDGVDEDGWTWHRQPVTVAGLDSVRLELALIITEDGTPTEDGAHIYLDDTATDGMLTGAGARALAAALVEVANLLDEHVS